MINGTRSPTWPSKYVEKKFHMYTLDPFITHHQFLVTICIHLATTFLPAISLIIYTLAD